ncbi:hypothetical protein ACP4OV_017006 [Aristida adscensionis]
MAASARRPPPELMDDLVEEVLLRLPPGEPASLARAALVCKRWRRLLSDPGFCRRLRELHRAPPLLGFVCRRGQATRFTPTSSFRPRHAGDDFFPAHRYAIDARHGLLLSYDLPSSSPSLLALAVSNPISGEVRRLPSPPPLNFTSASWSAALLCGTAGCGCDRLDGAGAAGPFLVVVVSTKASSHRTCACVYSSEAGAWSKATSIGYSMDHVLRGRGALVGNSLYFLYRLGSRILESTMWGSMSLR